MDVANYILLSQQEALQRRLDTVANNMANLSTAGFKREQPVFHEQVETDPAAPTRAAQRRSFVLDYGAIHDLSDGAFQSSGNPLDVAIQGGGYLAVALPDGSTGYTRNGALQILPSGELGTSAGYPVKGEGGRAITIPAGGTAGLTIRADGTITNTGGPIGRMAVTRFDSEAGLAPQGNGIFSGTGGQELPANGTHLQSGGTEGSNVQPIAETTAMIDILRAYQTSQGLAASLDDMRKQAIDRLGRAS